MSQRCPGSVSLGLAVLTGYRLRFDGTSSNWSAAAAANVIPSPVQSVWGVLYEVTEQHLAALDKYENAPINYQRWPVSVYSRRLGRCGATAYLRLPRLHGQPSSAYIARILESALQQGAPSRYIAQLSREANAAADEADELLF
jgi:gamma-glutamylcyclotransferase (GGCT)/AIG2-like uncharacterized protein YtfP